MDDEQKRISQTGVRVFSTQDIALEILMILEKNRIPIYKLDEVLDQEVYKRQQLCRSRAAFPCRGQAAYLYFC